MLSDGLSSSVCTFWLAPLMIATRKLRPALLTGRRQLRLLARGREILRVPSCLLHRIPPADSGSCRCTAPCSTQHKEPYEVRSVLRLNCCVTYLHCSTELPCLTPSSLRHATCYTVHVNDFFSLTCCQLNVSVSLQVSLVPESAPYCLLL